jgi:Cytochrome c
LGNKRPDPNDAVANGRYLVDILSCYHCHSKNIPGLNYTNPEDSKGYMKGGMKFKSSDGKKIRSADITQTGIAEYTENDLKRALKNGDTPEGRKLRFPMPKFKDLTDEQISQIYAYLKTRRRKTVMARLPRPA